VTSCLLQFNDMSVIQHKFFSWRKNILHLRGISWLIAAILPPFTLLFNGQIWTTTCKPLESNYIDMSELFREHQLTYYLSLHLNLPEVRWLFKRVHVRCFTAHLQVALQFVGKGGWSGSHISISYMHSSLGGGAMLQNHSQSLQ